MTDATNLPTAAEARPEPMLVFRPSEATAREMREEDREYRRHMRRAAFWLAVLAVFFAGQFVFSVAMGWWDMAVPLCIASGMLGLQAWTTKRGFPGAEGRYHSVHPIECTMRVYEEHETSDREFFAAFGPVSDAPPEHAEEYTALAHQLSLCLRYRKQLEDRLAQLRGEPPADEDGPVD